MSNTKGTLEFHEEIEKLLVKFRQDRAADKGGHQSNEQSCNHTAFLRGARTPGMMSLLNLARCILLNKRVEAQKHAINEFKPIGRFIKNRMDQIFLNDISHNTDLQDLLRESTAIEDEILGFLPTNRAHLLLKYDEITNHICNVLREEAYLYGICNGVEMESAFPDAAGKNS